MGRTKDASIVSTCLVKPDRRENGERFDLSIIDRINLFVPFLRHIIFYPAVTEQDYPSFIRRLKWSLAQILVKFFPLAGRIQLIGPCKPQLLCDDQGVVFSEALIDSTVEDLGEIQPSDLCDGLIQTVGTAETCALSPDVPLLFLQITKFVCGGISLGFAVAHQITDGVGIYEFLKGWSEIASGKAVSWDPVISYSFPRQESSYKTMAQVGFDIEEEEEKEEEEAPTEKPTQFDICNFVFSNAKIESLKSAAAPAKFTAFEILGAHLWCALARARALAEEEQSDFYFVMDCRKRLPSVPHTYFGNAALDNVAKAKVGDLNSKGLPYAADLVHRAIKDANSDKLHGIANVLEDLIENAGEEYEEICKDKNPQGCLMMEGSHRFPVFEVDFGFGKAVAVTLAKKGSWSDGMVQLFPAPLSLGIQATISLVPQAMCRLKRDPLFC